MNLSNIYLGSEPVRNLPPSPPSPPRTTPDPPGKQPPNNLSGICPPAGRDQAGLDGVPQELVSAAGSAESEAHRGSPSRWMGQKADTLVHAGSDAHARRDPAGRARLMGSAGGRLHPWQRWAGPACGGAVLSLAGFGMLRAARVVNGIPTAAVARTVDPARAVRTRAGRQLRLCCLRWVPKERRVQMTLQ